jgi:hypothetical protein
MDPSEKSASIVARVAEMGRFHQMPRRTLRFIIPTREIALDAHLITFLRVADIAD